MNNESGEERRGKRSGELDFNHADCLFLPTRSSVTDRPSCHFSTTFKYNTIYVLLSNIKISSLKNVRQTRRLAPASNANGHGDQDPSDRVSLARGCEITDAFVYFNVPLDCFCLTVSMNSSTPYALLGRSSPPRPQLTTFVEAVGCDVRRASAATTPYLFPQPQ